MPVVSVIVPNYNHSNYLKQRMDSILSQTYQDFEIIILDDCSTDDSLKVLNQYKDYPKVTHFIVNDKNSGSVFRQWNKGVSLAQGEFIWIAESDDIASPVFLESLVDKLIGNEALGISFCQSNKINSLGEVYGDWINHTKEKEKNIFINSFEMSGNLFIKNFLIHQNSIPNASGVIFRKSFYLKSGGAPEHLKTIGDWNVWVKILSFSNIYFCHEKLNYFRMHDSSCVAISSKTDIRANIILMHFYMYKDLFEFLDKENKKISKIFKHKKNMAASRFFFNCISHKNYQILLNNFYSLRLFFIFLNMSFYIVLFRLFLFFLLRKEYSKL
ncbi:glycosyltransferase family 2 protein [Acinetobacter sp. ANC 4641]|uniref:glycosyltransferase family 2 protein n=1 Tax=Acinetobacter sp. ANC 4641 TaxID=2529847 RepID=UPI00103AAF22|nr:glycosyltransferase family 2 protein [Acinetobacter sp. ANC 4641]TCB13542.1 glycosyltransferase family 2 protein [Acinetobacter sp. ANC 4641]